MSYQNYNKEYAKGESEKGKRESKSIFTVEMYGERYQCENISGLDAEGLIKAYAACEKPFKEMQQYGREISDPERAYIEQGDELSSTIHFEFSIEFNTDRDEIRMFSQNDNGHFDVEEKRLQETIAEKRLQVASERPSVIKNLQQKRAEINCNQKGDEQRTIERKDRGIEI